MKLFLLIVLLVEGVVLYYTKYTRYRDLLVWRDSVLESKYKLISTTTQSYAPKKQNSQDESDSSDYSLPMNISTHMTYEDAHELFHVKKSQACVPDSFGYTSEQADVIFPHRGYPRCTERYRGFEVPEITVDLVNNTFKIDCKNTTYIEYFTGPAGQHNFTSGKISVADLEIKRYNGPTTMPENAEFIMAKCGKDADFDLAAMWLRKNERVYADSIMGRDLSVKPLLIGYIVLDSFSRRHSFQKLPETIKFLNTLNKDSSYEVHDFKLHNVIGDGSAENIVPVMTRQYSDFEERLVYDPKHRDDYIWNNIADKGFITLFGTEACEGRFNRCFGNDISAHHILRQFYCGAQHIGHFSYRKFGTEQQRCIGPHMSHVYGLNYLYQFTQSYSLANKWFYSHFEAAHEATGQHAETLDIDLRNFLRKLLDYTSDTHNVALIINADHGMRFGDWQRDTAAFQEAKLPALFTVTSKELLDMIPNSRHTLAKNSWRLNSKKDIRRTMLYLSNYPNFIDIPQEDEVTNYSLYSEEIDIDRSCMDARIPAWYCACVNFKDIDLKYAREENKELHDLLHYITEYAIFIMNKETYSGYSIYTGRACQKIQLKKIDRAFAFAYNSMSELIKIQFTVTNQMNASFTALFLLSPQPWASVKKHQSFYSYGRLESYMYRGYMQFFKIINLSRMDPFEGECASYARSLNIKPDFCFCKEGYEEEMKE